MEDVLDVYTRPYNASHPLICMDEGGKTLQAQAHDPLPMRAGQAEWEGDKHEWERTCSVFLAVEPLAGKRIIEARARRTKEDWAYFLRELIEIHSPHAKKIVLVMDNLNVRTVQPSATR
ncbi:transposase [Ktedonospora formicarum]|nr:transposase [Ktedonospora formicarum]